MKLVALPVFVVMLFFSCSRSKEASNIGHVSLPERLEVYNPFLGKDLKSSANENAKSKIYTLVDVSCSTCIFKLEKWNEFQSEIKDPKTVEFIPICYSKDKFELIKFLFENNKIAKIKFPLFLDVDDKFITQNRALISSTGVFTVLTDAENNVILSGNPVENMEDKNTFLAKIQEIH